jgi:hypothetical protein
MKKQALNAFLSLICLTATSAQCAIAYSNGPSFPVPPEYATRSIDLNNDGAPDFSFWSSGPICTADVPTSYCSWPYSVGAVGTNQMLAVVHLALLQPFGVEIGSTAPPGAAWSAPFFGAGELLTARWWSREGQVIDGQLVHDGWYGSIGNLGVAYLGTGSYAADGLHYGWVRIRLPSPDLGPGGFPLEFAPAVVDWAYETRPDKPIRAGDIDSTKESVQFTVEFLTPHPRPRHPAQVVGTGSLILTGNTLRGEISLAGQFSSAQILGPEHLHARVKPVLDFGLPLVNASGHTAFFHEAPLTRSQVEQLLHGAYYVSIDNGALAARILPLAPLHHDREDKR